MKRDVAQVRGKATLAFETRAQLAEVEQATKPLNNTADEINAAEGADRKTEVAGELPERTDECSHGLRGGRLASESARRDVSG
jgi:hypothetical protein